MKKVLAIAAHPDDIEYFMSGTMMALKETGYELHYINLANGCCGSTQFDRRETATIRRQESMEACEFIGAIYHESICDDMDIFYDRPTLAKVAAVVRQAQPDILLPPAPSDYMEDHMNTCRLAVTAAFARGMPNFPTTPTAATYDAPITIYHAQPYSHLGPLRQVVQPDLWIDVTDLVDSKVEMLAKHTSQKQWLDESQGHDSYLQVLRDLDKQAGNMSGQFEYAEGWRRHLHLGFCQPQDDPLRIALQERAHLVTD